MAAAPAHPVLRVNNAEVAQRLREVADLLELRLANPFRVRAYRNAARAMEELSRSVLDLPEEGPKSLENVPGIGADLAEKIREIATSGSLDLLEQLRRKVPKGLPELMRLRGLGPKRARLLRQKLGIRSLADLERALRARRLRKLRGFGEKSEAKLLHELAFHRGGGQRVLRVTAAQFAEPLVEYLRKGVVVEDVVLAGSFRRRSETVGDLDLLAISPSAAPVVRRFVTHPDVEEVLSQGKGGASVRLRSGLQVDLRVLDPESAGAGLYYFTGSKAHNIAVRRLAQGRGLKLNEYGVFRKSRRIAGRTEREVVRAVGLRWIPPELRENRGEIEAAKAGRLPSLIELADIRGDLQCHTTASDGRETLQAMVHAAVGYARMKNSRPMNSSRAWGGSWLNDQRLTLASQPVCSRACATVSNTGRLRCVLPPLPGEVPPTILVP